MDELISRNEAIKWFFRPYSNEEYYSNLDVARALKAIPAVDAVPVVRCRDCKYSDTFYKTTEDTMPLKCLNIRYGGVMPNWYCEHGERRDDDATS